MIALYLLCATLCLGQAVGAQSPDPPPPAGAQRLLIPDVTLFGRDTVFLPVPLPEPGLGLPVESTSMDRVRRLPLPHAPGPLRFPEPPPMPPAGRAARLGSAGAAGLASEGDAPSPQTGHVASGAPGLRGASGDRAGGAGREWQTTVDYLPARALAVGLAGQGLRGPWGSRSTLRVHLPDGWLAEQARQPGVAQAAVQARREGVPVRLSLSAAGGLLEPPVNPRTFCLETAQELQAVGRAVRFAESTAFQLCSRPESTPSRAGSACQRLELVLGRAGLGLRLEGAAAGRLEAGSAAAETGAVLSVAGVYAGRTGALRVEAGACALHYRKELAVRPAVCLDLSPAAWLRLRGSAASFLRLTPDPEALALYTPAGESVLRLEGGYHMEASLVVDLTPAFEASAAVSWDDGHRHRLAEGVATFGRDRRAGGAAGISWRPAAWVSLGGRAGAEWDLSDGLAGAALVSPDEEWASAWVQADFSKIPTAFIMQASWGQAPIGETDPAGFLPWEFFDGFQAALRASVRVRPDQSLSAGLQVLLPLGSGEVEARFLVGYAARLSTFEPRGRAR